MTESRTYALLLPLAPLRVGDAVDRASWPLHVTLVTNFRLEGAFDSLVATVRQAAVRLPPLDGVVGASTWFGREHDIAVELVDGPVLAPAHRALLDAIDAALPIALIEPAAHRAGYRPHVTRRADDRVHRGSMLQLREVVLAELDPAGRPGTADVVARFPVGGPSPVPVVTADAAAGLVEALVEGGVHPSVIGGWGIDALVAEQTREHHDLDLLVHVDDLPALERVLAAEGYVVRSVWSENRWIDHCDVRFPSAFVAEGPAGEVDVHIVATRNDGGPRSLSTSTVRLPADALTGSGSIAGRPVPCATAEAQLTLHAGYEVPEHQRGDLERLRTLRR